MREIKFRAWLKEHKTMVNVAEIDINHQLIYHYGFDDFEGNFENFNSIELLQYTDLKDKNGKEIYEGDIVFESFGENYYKVIFENGSFRAEFKGDFEEYSLDLIDVVAQSCEVVGNIYENPELMEEVRWWKR